MADTKSSALTANTAPATGDGMLIVDDLGGSPDLQVITLSNLFKIINGFSADSTPIRSSDYVVTYDASASAAKKVLLNNLGSYVMEFGCVAFNPADATTYYLSNRFGGNPGTTIAGYKIFIPRTGTITKAYIQFSQVVGSSETSTVSIRLNDTSDTTITSSVDLSTGPSQYSNTGLSISVTAGGYVTIKWVTPTWATNPTSVDISGFIYVE